MFITYFHYGTHFIYTCLIMSDFLMTFFSYYLQQFVFNDINANKLKLKFIKTMFYDV